MDLRIPDKDEVDDFPVLVKSRMNKSLFASQLLSPHWFISIWNRPRDEGCDRLGLALDWPNPTSKREAIVSRVLPEGPEDDVDPGLIGSAMVMESGESYCICIAVSSDECLDQPVGPPAFGAGLVLPVRLAVEAKARSHPHILIRRGLSSVPERRVVGRGGLEPSTAAVTSLEPAPRTLPELSNWERRSALECEDETWQ